MTLPAGVKLMNADAIDKMMDRERKRKIMLICIKRCQQY